MWGADLLIRGGTVILPTGEARADIAVTNGTISAIGSEVRDAAIAAGADADFAIVDPDRDWTFESSQLETRSGISPYLGRTFRGAVVRTIARGRTVYADGAVTGQPGWGKLVTPDSPHAH